MSGTKILLDTNIIIYFLQGDDLLNSFLIDKDVNISIINEMEVYSGINLTNKEKENIDDFLVNLKVININNSIKERTIKLRQKYKIKLPDAIIAATSIENNIPLLSADKDFDKIQELDFIYYKF